MKKKRNNIIVIIFILILIILSAISFIYSISDKGMVTNAIKMELETAEGEIRDRLLSLLNNELVCASADIDGTKEDISTRYNEPNLIRFLKGNKNFADTDHAENEAILCIEDFEGDSDGVIELTPMGGEEIIKSKYRIISIALCSDGNKYGIGKHISDGDIFTLEAVITKDDDNNDVYEGKYELKYYDRNNNVKVLETVSLYLTNQS